MSSGDYTLRKKYAQSTQRSLNATCDNNTNETYCNICIKNNSQSCNCKQENNYYITNTNGGYTSVTKLRISKHNLESEKFFIIKIDKGLSYCIDDKITIVSIEENLKNVYQGFNAEVQSYNTDTGEIVLKNIQNITPTFDNGLYKYKISLINMIIILAL